MIDEQRLIEKLRRIEALHAGAATLTKLPPRVPNRTLDHQIPRRTLRQHRVEQVQNPVPIEVRQILVPQTDEFLHLALGWPRQASRIQS